MNANDSCVGNGFLQLIPLKDPISIIAIKNLILDLKLAENDVILLHSHDFDDIALEYRTTYKESLIYPFYLLGVLILVDFSSKVGIQNVGITNLENGVANLENFEVDINSPDESHEYDTIYRCGWCGNIVDFDGTEFDSMIRNSQIKILEKFMNTVTVVKVTGACCIEKRVD